VLPLTAVESPDIVDMVSWLLRPPAALSAIPVSPPGRLSPDEQATSRPSNAEGNQILMEPPLQSLESPSIY
jgi:hypothetical protein